MNERVRISKRSRAWKRRSEIIRALSNMSRNGWEGCCHPDYEPLEEELSRINHGLGLDRADRPDFIRK